MTESQSETAHFEPEPKLDPSTVYCFRAHRVTALLVENYRRFAKAFGEDKVFILADETSSVTEWPSDMRVHRLTRSFLDSIRLYHDFSKVGWRCGDYFYYLALQALTFDRLWLIEDRKSTV